jgi:hypothetical protein
MKRKTAKLGPKNMLKNAASPLQVLSRAPTSRNTNEINSSFIGVLFFEQPLA